MQREFDAVTAAMQDLGLSATAPLTTVDYLKVGQTMQSEPVLEERAVQGHGISGTSSIRYRGYVNDIAAATGSVKYTGGGVDTGRNALSVFPGDNIPGNTPFAVVWHNGKLVRLDENGDPVMTLANAVAAADDAMWNRTDKASDFSK